MATTAALPKLQLAPSPWRSSTENSTLVRAVVAPRSARISIRARATPENGYHASGSEARRQRASVPRLPQAAKQMAVGYVAGGVGLLTIAAVVAPMMGALVLGSICLGLATAALALAASLSWLVVVPLFGFVAIPLLLGSGIWIVAGALLVPMLLQAGLLGMGLWVGGNIARSLFFGGAAAAESSVDAQTATIDIEASTVDTRWQDELDAEARRRQAELSEFDELLRRRGRFKQGGSGGL